MVDAPTYVDWTLGIVFLIAFLIQCLWIAFHGHSLGRWMQAIGFCGVGVRLVWSLSAGQDPQVAAISIPFLILLAGGTSLTAIQQMRLLWMDVRCMQQPEHRCYREDRVRDAIKEKVTWLRRS